MINLTQLQLRGNRTTETWNVDPMYMQMHTHYVCAKNLQVGKRKGCGGLGFLFFGERGGGVWTSPDGITSKYVLRMSTYFIV